ALRPKLVDLIHELEGEYHRNLRTGAPAYDPSWLWSELKLDDRSAAVHPPPLAHERLPSFLPGIQELCHKVAEQVRRRPGFKDASTILDAHEIQRDAEIQRFLLEECGAPYAEDTHAGSASQSTMTSQRETMVTSNAVIPEGTICSAQLTPPFPANSSRKPVTAAVFQWVLVGRTPVFQRSMG